MSTFKGRARPLFSLMAAAGLVMAAGQGAHAGAPSPRPDFYYGADLSYVNEMQDCGARYRDKAGLTDPFAIFKAHGTNLVRVRLWNDSHDWTKYSDLADVEKTIRRAKAAGMQVLLDFHYSDTWADGDKQIPPKAWTGTSDPKALADLLYRFTFDTLRKLDAEGLAPDMVQVGNETNTALLGSKKGDAIDWPRNALLFNAGIRAVHDAGAQGSVMPRIMLHIAQPENAEPWFKAADAAGITGYDVIGISYYSKWSTQTMEQMGQALARMKHDHGKDVVVVETAYPWTLQNADTAPNLLGDDAVARGFPASPKGQLQYLQALTRTVKASGGVGVVYWEPAWLSTKCKTPWATGSGWDNATFFDHGGKALPSLDWPQ